MSKNKNQYKYDAENGKEYFSRNEGVTWEPYSSSDTGWQKLVKKFTKLFSGYTDTAATNLTKDQVIKTMESTVNMLLECLQPLQRILVKEIKIVDVDDLDYDEKIFEIQEWLYDILEYAQEELDDYELARDERLSFFLQGHDDNS